MYNPQARSYKDSSADAIVKLRSLDKLSLGDIRILGEAMALAIPVEIGMRCLPLDALVSRLGGTCDTDRRQAGLDIERAARLIEAVAVFYPLKATCLKKSLILLRILRKRGVPAELRLGVRKVHDDFTSHAWIECEGRTLLGGGVEHLYATLPAPALGHSGAQRTALQGSRLDRGDEASNVLR
jgi:hypothetical protein